MTTLSSLFIASAVLLATGCSTPVDETTPAASAKPQTMSAGPARQVNITVKDYQYMPSQIVAKPGEKLHLVLSNMGQNEHSITFDLPAGAVQMPSNVDPGKTMEYDVQAPTQPGRYYFHCPVGNHYSRGMVGELLVK